MTLTKELQNRLDDQLNDLAFQIKQAAINPRLFRSKKWKMATQELDVKIRATRQQLDAIATIKKFL